jgi:hypothetical protein
VHAFASQTHMLILFLTCTHTCTHTYTQTHACTQDTCMHTQMHAHRHRHMYEHRLRHMHAHTHRHMHAHMHIDTCLHTYTCIHTCMHTQRHLSFQGLMFALKAFTAKYGLLVPGIVNMLFYTPGPDFFLSSHTQSSRHYPSLPFLPLTSVAAASRTVRVPSSLSSAQCSGRRVLAQAQAALPALPLWSNCRAVCQVGQRPIQTPKESAQGSRVLLTVLLQTSSWRTQKSLRYHFSYCVLVFLTSPFFPFILLSFLSFLPSFLPSNPPSLTFPHPEKNLIPSTAGNTGLPAPTWWVRSNAVFPGAWRFPSGSLLVSAAVTGFTDSHSEVSSLAAPGP